MNSPETLLLQGILSTLARQTFPPDKLYELVVPKSSAKVNAIAFNLCDGTRSQAEIADTSGIDKGNLSKRIQRWVDAGVVLKVPVGKTTYPLHVYPIPEHLFAEKGKKA